MPKFLIDISISQGDENKVFDNISKMASICKPDEGWYWYISQYLGDIYANYQRRDSAITNYENALKSIQQACIKKAINKRQLYESGHLTMPDGFTSWEDEVLKEYMHNISHLKELLEELKSR